MADNDQPSRLEAATIKAEVGSDIVYRVANLPADQTVATDSGNIPTLAGVLDYVQNEGDAAAADVRAKADAQVQDAIGTLVKKAGDTMTGPLVLSGDPSAGGQAARKSYVDNADSVAVSTATSNSKTYTDQQISALPKPFSKYFESNQFTIGSAGVLISAPHGLGLRPKYAGATLVFLAATAGYAAGDTIELSAHSTAGGSNVTLCDIYYDSVRVYLQFSSSANLIYSVLTKNGGGGATSISLASNNFAVILRAFI